MSWGAVVLTFLLIAFVITAYLRPTLPLDTDESDSGASGAEPSSR